MSTTRQVLLSGCIRGLIWQGLVCEKYVEALVFENDPRKPRQPLRQRLQRKALLVIGAQHPVWNGDRMPNYDRFVNSLLSTAREAVDAQGADDDAKADWCAAEMEKYP